MIIVTGEKKNLKIVNSARAVNNTKIINSTRQVELDIVKGLAILFMIFVHTMDSYLDQSHMETIYAKVITFFGCAPAAPVFMFAMGVGFVYSRNQSPAKLFKRGALIFLLGYLLNFLRGFLPVFIGSQLGYYELTVDGPWYEHLIEVDILQFAGMAMMFVSFLKLIKLKEFFYPVIGIIVGVTSVYVREISFKSFIPDIFLANLFGYQEYAYHPFFSWIFYPLMGALFGWVLIRVKNKQKFYIVATWISAIICAICLVYYFKIPELNLGIVVGDPYNYFNHGIFGNIAICSFVVFWIGLWYFLSPIIPKFLINKFIFWSKSITSIYVVHWIILGWISALFIDSLDILETTVAILLILFTTDRFVDAYNRIKNSEKYKVVE